MKLGNFLLSIITMAIGCKFNLFLIVLDKTRRTCDWMKPVHFFIHQVLAQETQIHMQTSSDLRYYHVMLWYKLFLDWWSRQLCYRLTCFYLCWEKLGITHKMSGKQRLTKDVGRPKTWSASTKWLTVSLGKEERSQVQTMLCTIEKMSTIMNGHLFEYQMLKGSSQHISIG